MAGILKPPGNFALTPHKVSICISVQLYTPSSALLPLSFSPIISLSKITKMAVTFSVLNTESGLKALNEFLSNKSYISEDQLTKDDIKVYAAVLEKPSDLYTNASHWSESISSKVAASFPGKAAGVRIGGHAAPAVHQLRRKPRSLLVMMMTIIVGSQQCSWNVR
ncbi:unnamed protein product [Fraxinus pennsylvanica]|uniref:Uncharacterized protein n=1 Tax=Fraxinus pennsylvanica TaxID=56036 RepID=A0AAD1Z8J6_9LAMI|nr:unnamed protein product [Fraxinus pennsylvanica]